MVALHGMKYFFDIEDGARDTVGVSFENDAAAIQEAHLRAITGTHALGVHEGLRIQVRNAKGEIIHVVDKRPHAKRTRRS